MKKFFDEVADAWGGASSFDDVATALAGIAFCTVSVSMFVVVFAGAM